MTTITKNIFFAMALALMATINPAVAEEEKPLAPETIEGAETVTAEDIFTLVEEKDNLVIIDSRKERDYKEGHIQDAVRLINTEANPETMAEVIPSMDTPVLIYCNGPRCGRAAKTTKKAVDAGYTEVYYYYNGMNEWNDMGLPVITEE